MVAARSARSIPGGGRPLAAVPGSARFRKAPQKEEFLNKAEGKQTSPLHHLCQPPPACVQGCGREVALTQNPRGAAPRTAHPITGQVTPLGWHASTKHPKGDASPDVILPSAGLQVLLGMQVSLSHASLSILVPSSSERLISMVQSQVAFVPNEPQQLGVGRGWLQMPRVSLMQTGTRCHPLSSAGGALASPPAVISSTS